jgi:hypothetical protein
MHSLMFFNLFLYICFSLQRDRCVTGYFKRFKRKLTTIKVN